MTDVPEVGAGAVTDRDPVSRAQTRAAHAYANVVLEPEIAAAAAEDALAAFRQTVAQRPDLQTAAQSAGANETLLALTRLMTAVSVPDRSSPEDRRQAVWASIGSASHCTCRESAALLATRANGNIQPRESAALDEHLAGCAECRELSVRTAAADTAFRKELTPRGPSGFGLPSVPRAAYALLALIVAAGVAVFALTSSSNTSTTHAAVAPVETQATSSFVVSVATTTTTAVHPARPKRTRKPKRAAKKVPHRTAKAKPAAAPSPSPSSTPAADSDTSAATSASGSDDSSAAPDSSAATDSAGAPAPSHSSPASQPTPAPSSASVSGQSSLPADSAPQQGIGSLTTTTTAQ